MAYKYYLTNNHLTENNNFMAIAAPGKSKNLDDLIKIILMQNSNFSETTVRAVVNELIKSIEFWVEEGHSINTPLFNLAPSISGVFEEANEDFDPGKHKINLNLTTGTRLKALQERLRVERIDGTALLPKINHFKDISSKTHSSIATSGKPALIKGSRLRFNEEDVQQGIFLINDAKKEFKVTDIIEHAPSKVSFLLPTLAKGTYTLVLRSDMNSKTLREGMAPFKLTVA